MQHLQLQSSVKRRKTIQSPGVVSAIRGEAVKACAAEHGLGVGAHIRCLQDGGPQTSQQLGSRVGRGVPAQLPEDWEGRYTQAWVLTEVSRRAWASLRCLLLPAGERRAGIPRADACAFWKAARSRLCAGGGGAGLSPGGGGCLGGGLARVACACWALTRLRFIPAAF